MQSGHVWMDPTADIAVELWAVCGSQSERWRIGSTSLTAPAPAALNLETPCRDRFCSQGSKCSAVTLQCTPTGDCNPKCASGTACFAGVCEAILDQTKLDALPQGNR